MEYQPIFRAILRKVGRFVKDSQKNISNISYKEGKEIVTDVDFKSEEMIKFNLKKRFPKYNYYGEEEGLEDNKSEYTFFIDPVDGTAAYVYNLDKFCVVLSLVKKEAPLAAAIYIPKMDEFYYAEKGKGAFLNGKRIHVSDKGRPIKKRVGASSVTGLRKIGYQKVWAIGHAACSVASGKMDGAVQIFKKKITPLESPAIYLLVTEAGGKMTNLKGDKWKLPDRRLIFSNGKIHEELVKLSSKTPSKIPS